MTADSNKQQATWNKEGMERLVPVACSLLAPERKGGT